MKNFFRKLYDIFLGILIIPCSLVLLKYKKRAPQNHPFATFILKKIGIFPIINHYYEPKFNFTIQEEKVHKKRNLKSIKLNVPQQLNLLKKLKFASEIKDLFVNKKTKNYNFYINNGSFEECDSEIYYQMIRHLKPKKIIEIGSGHSTLICLEAIKKNNFFTDLTCIEPFENKWLEKLKIKVLRKKLENTNINWSKKLNKNDILFIDSSHIIKPDGDVLKFYLEILPRLKKGVVVHIHDIFTPKNYNYDWVFKHLRLWNEQYLLEGILSNSNRYEVLLSLNFLKNKYFGNLKKSSPFLKKKTEPASIYLRVK